MHYMYADPGTYYSGINFLLVRTRILQKLTAVVQLVLSDASNLETQDDGRTAMFTGMIYDTAVGKMPIIGM